MRTSTVPSERNSSHVDSIGLAASVFGRVAARNCVNASSPRMVAPAASTARTIRCCAPQRQRFLSSVETTASLSGSGSRSSSQAPLTITPDRQYPHCPAWCVEDRRLQRVGSAVTAETLDRDDALSCDRPERCVAGRDHRIVDNHEAGAAQPHTAAEARTRQAKLAVQDVEQRHVGLRLDDVPATVHLEFVRLTHAA